jgi:hypothetical protein
LRTAGFSAGGSIRVLKRYTGRAEELESMDEPERTRQFADRTQAPATGAILR